MATHNYRDIVVALLNDIATVQRLYYQNGEIQMLPKNHRLKPVAVEADDDLQIVCKVAVRRAVGK